MRETSALGPCTSPAKEQVVLLQEDEFHPGAVGCFCPTPGSKYVTQRYMLKCSHSGCKRLGSIKPRTRANGRAPDLETVEGEGKIQDTKKVMENLAADLVDKDPRYQQLLDGLREMRESLPREKEHITEDLDVPQDANNW